MCDRFLDSRDVSSWYISKPTKMQFGILVSVRNFWIYTEVECDTLDSVFTVIGNLTAVECCPARRNICFHDMHHWNTKALTVLIQHSYYKGRSVKLMVLQAFVI